MISLTLFITHFVYYRVYSNSLPLKKKHCNNKTKNNNVNQSVVKMITPVFEKRNCSLFVGIVNVPEEYNPGKIRAHIICGDGGWAKNI